MGEGDVVQEPTKFPLNDVNGFSWEKRSEFGKHPDMLRASLCPSHPYCFSSKIDDILGRLSGQLSKLQSAQSKSSKHWKPAFHWVLLLVGFGVIVISSKSGNEGLLLVGKLVKVNTLWKP